METNEIKQIGDVIDEKMKSLKDAVYADTATKKDFDTLTKHFNDKMATLAMRGEDAERDAGKELKTLKACRVKNFINKNKKLKEAMVAEAIESCISSRVFDRDYKRAEALKAHYSSLIKTNSNTNEEDSNSGLGMLPTQVDPLLHKLIPLTGIARSQCTVKSGVQGSININTLSSYPTGGFTLNGSTPRGDAAVTPNSGVYAKINVQPLQASWISKVEEKLMFDSVVDVWTETVVQLAIAIGLWEDNVVFMGNGVADAANGGLTGVCKTTDLGYTGTATTARTGSFTDLTPFWKMQQNVYPSILNEGDTAYHMHPFTAAFIRTLTASTSGLYFYDPSASSFVLGGVPIVYNQVMDAPDAGLETFTATKVPVLFGSMSKGVTIVIGREAQIRIADQKYFDTNEIAVRATQDWNFGIALKPALSRLLITT